MAKATSAYAPEGQALDQGIFETVWHTRCDGCGSRYDLEGWSQLAVVTRIESKALESQVMGWPADQVVEVRRCGRCARTVSRRRPAKGTALRAVKRV